MTTAEVEWQFTTNFYGAMGVLLDVFGNALSDA
jgi:hypothetical protein